MKRHSLYPAALSDARPVEDSARVDLARRWARAAAALRETLEVTLDPSEAQLLRDLLDAAGHAARLAEDTTVLVSQFTPQVQADLERRAAHAESMLAVLREQNQLYDPRPRAHLLRHFQKQVALPERYGLHLSMADVERIDAAARTMRPHLILRGAPVVTVPHDGHDLIVVLTPDDTLTLTATTTYTPAMIRVVGGLDAVL